MIPKYNNTSPRTDLASESARMTAAVPGVRSVTRNIGGVKITDIRIPPAASHTAQHPPGRYITLEGDPAQSALPALLKRGLEQLIPPSGVILAAGLGNPDITRDSLGALTVRRLAARCGSVYRLCAVETDVAVRTGIETARMLRALVREIKPSCVIAIDSLCCVSPLRICRTVQLSTAGIVPGSGTADPRPELSQNTVGVPVIAAGVPTAVLLSTLTSDPRHSSYLAAPADEDIQTRLWSACLSDAINAIIR